MRHANSQTRHANGEMRYIRIFLLASLSLARSRYLALSLSLSLSLSQCYLEHDQFIHQDCGGCVFVSVVVVVVVVVIVVVVASRIGPICFLDAFRFWLFFVVVVFC